MATLGGFNPRTREGCDNKLVKTCISLSCVSIHAPVKGATILRILYERLFICFNPRTREGCDEQMRKNEQELNVSIHAPVKGATNAAISFVPFLIVSIHAPVKGATSLAHASGAS